MVRAKKIQGVAFDASEYLNEDTLDAFMLKEEVESLSKDVRDYWECDSCNMVHETEEDANDCCALEEA